MIDKVLKHLENDSENAVRRLIDVLSIPSISNISAYEQDVQRCGQWVADALGAVGLEVSTYDTPGAPIVIGRWHNAGSAPHVLFYGHYDVQPPDPLGLWTTPPFEPDIRDGAIYARGASDDKGQVCCFIEALRAWHSTSGGFPVNITVMIEGEEESGSPHIKPFVQEHRDALLMRNGSSTDDHVDTFVLVSDTLMWDPEHVGITYGMRGLCSFEIKLHGPSRDLHSGMYGGILANPANMIARVLSRLMDDDNRVTVPGFYDDVVPVTDDEREQWSKLGFDDSAYLGTVGVTTRFGETGYDTLARKWARPSCDVNGLFGGYQGEGGKTVIPAVAGAKVSFRLAPNQSPAKVADMFTKWLKSHDVGGCRWEINDFGQADPVEVDVDSPYILASSRAIEQCSGRPPVLMREGATLPIIADFKNILGVDCVLVGFGLEDDCIHSPDENFGIDRFKLGCRTHAAILAEL